MHFFYGRRWQVHLIQSNHFDAGYKDLTVVVINLYFDMYFPRAAKIGSECANTSHQLRWMTQGWLVNLYLSCPPGLGLHCPSKEALTLFKTAVASGWITWHAFPHNAHLETARPEMITAGIGLVHALDDSFQLARKRVLSQRDVPGMARSTLKLYAVSLSRSPFCFDLKPPLASPYSTTNTVC